ncbi:hypothetical protein pb186bvf_012453 [Paramecium bursaria]
MQQINRNDDTYLIEPHLKKIRKSTLKQIIYKNFHIIDDSDKLQDELIDEVVQLSLKEQICIKKEKIQI